MKNLLLAVCLSFALFGQENCIQGTPSHVTARYRGPEGVGYSQGYTTLEGFITPNWQRAFQPFLDIRGHMFDNGRPAVNAGLGSRWNIFGNWALGANFFYDFRDAKRLPVHQLGPGLELLSPYIDFRINGYIPIGTTQRLKNFTFSRFTGVGNSLVATRQYTAALPCLAGEVGLSLGPFLDPYFSVGPYYLYKQSQSSVSAGGVWGGLGRLSLQLFDWMTIGGELSYDKLFKTRANGFVSLSLPLGPNTIRS
ncbi:MAG: inverse autotransporter beta domain-containing protein, partial [Chlamydiia bacterium]|nr:inverse autotransporter beta domain-containing protein [Chlamydiia bacterium]